MQKVRRRIEEDGATQDSSPSQNVCQDGPFGSLQPELSENSEDQRRMSDLSVRDTSIPASGFYRNTHRDARFFSDSCTPEHLSKDERLEYLSSLHSLTTQPNYFVSNNGVRVTAADRGEDFHIGAALSRSEPSYVGDDNNLAFRSYAGLSASTQERIRRFEMETRAMMQRDVARHRREMPDKRKIEEELQKAKQDLETEDIFDRIADNPSGKLAFFFT